MLNNIIIILITILSIYVLLKGRKKISALLLCLIIFDISYVLPLVIELFLGKPYLGYYGFKLALNDNLTDIVYYLFVFITQFLFLISLKKTQKIKKFDLIIEKFTAMRENLTVKFYIKIILFIICIIPILAWIFSPNPYRYFEGIGIFAVNNLIISDLEINYHTSIVKICNYIGCIGVIGLKFIDKNNSKILCLSRSVIIIIITLLDNKRTLFAFLMLVLLAIDVFNIRNRKKIIYLGVKTGGIILGYFIVYSYITGKYTYSPNLYSMYSEYFFRINVTKAAIYSILNPDYLRILDYPGQTFIYDLLFFIPREIWPDKPVAYPEYFSSAVHGFKTLTHYGWYFQTGCFAEIFSNFGLLGILLGPLFIIKICKISESNSNFVVGLIGTAFACLIQVFEYSDMFKIIFTFWIILLIFTKIKKYKFVWK